MLSLSYGLSDKRGLERAERLTADATVRLATKPIFGIPVRPGPDANPLKLQAIM
jgi:hypothetical protein